MRYSSKFGNTDIILEKESFAGGAEGKLYHIVFPLEFKGKRIAKLYHDHKLTDERISKLEYLYQHPPVNFEDSDHPSVIWPEDLIFDEDEQLRGFIMPFVKGKKLELLCSPKIKDEFQTEWGRFSFKSEESLNLRLKLCFNLAVALYLVHRTEQFVLVDLKPDNIIVQPNGLLSLVDMDSVEIITNGKTIYDAKVATPEYTPAEFYIRDLLDYDPTSKQEWDNFSLAVIFYKLLLGLHPFAGGNKAEFENCITLEQKIEKGLFVHHPNSYDFMEVVPPPHRSFNNLTPGIQELFIRCFVNGHDNPLNRPDAEEWCVILLDAIDDIKMKDRFSHLFSVTLFEIDNSAQRIPASFYFKDLKLEEVTIRAVLPAVFLYKPQPLADLPQKINDLLPDIEKNINRKKGFFEKLFENINNESRDSKLYQLAERAYTIIKTYNIKLKERSKLVLQINIFKDISFQNQWRDFIDSKIPEYNNLLHETDQKIKELSSAENDIYKEILSELTLTIKEHQLFKDLKGKNSKELRESLEISLVDDNDKKIKLNEFNKIVFEFHNRYLKERRNFDGNYKKLIDSARFHFDSYRKEFLEELKRMHYVIKHEMKTYENFSEYENLPKTLDNLQMEMNKIHKEYQELFK